jgi:hypothetical protein
MVAEPIYAEQIFVISIQHMISGRINRPETAAKNYGL